MMYRCNNCGSKGCTSTDGCNKALFEGGSRCGDCGTFGKGKTMMNQCRGQDSRGPVPVAAAGGAVSAGGGGPGNTVSRRSGGGGASEGNATPALLALVVVAPYAALFFGLSDPAGFQDDFEINEKQFHLVMFGAGLLALVVTYVLRRVVLVLGILAAIGFGFYLAFTSFGGEPAESSHSKESLREKCVKLVLSDNADKKMNRQEAIAYCNDFYP